MNKKELISKMESIFSNEKICGIFVAETIYIVTVCDKEQTPNSWNLTTYAVNKKDYSIKEISIFSNDEEEADEYRKYSDDENRRIIVNPKVE